MLTQFILVIVLSTQPLQLSFSELSFRNTLDCEKKAKELQRKLPKTSFACVGIKSIDIIGSV